MLKYLIIIMLVFSSTTARADFMYDRLLEKASSGDVTAQLEIGAKHYKAKDYKEAFKWLKKAAEQNDSNAQILLSAMYFKGQGTPKNQAATVKWIKRAAEQGNAGAKHLLVVMKKEGMK
ncbi:MAG: sel1 repeat family protein [Alphaproteobacteria bacterium]|nr:sel1 repeat family protein [Alphaproteobacteria bacterium]